MQPAEFVDAAAVLEASGYGQCAGQQWPRRVSLLLVVVAPAEHGALADAACVAAARRHAVSVRCELVRHFGLAVVILTPAQQLERTCDAAGVPCAVGDLQRQLHASLTLHRLHLTRDVCLPILVQTPARQTLLFVHCAHVSTLRADHYYIVQTVRDLGLPVVVQTPALRQCNPVDRARELEPTHHIGGPVPEVCGDVHLCCCVVAPAEQFAFAVEPAGVQEPDVDQPCLRVEVHWHVGLPVGVVAPADQFARVRCYLTVVSAT